jgi:hypothetical protein
MDARLTFQYRQLLACANFVVKAAVPVGWDLAK